jgi:RNA polymerase sigma-70 factor (ECF subfamily)
MRVIRGMPAAHDASDEELMAQLATGQQEALGPLYSRYAPLIFNLVAQSLDRAAAEEIVQDVFLAVWRRAETFDPERGAFRPWLLQIAHHRIVNELRRRSRQPQLEPDPEGLRLVNLPDREPEPAEEAWRAQRSEALQSAFEALTPAQRQALGLAFFEDLTHQQVAATLNLPLGTAKTRIRAGLQVLRGKLAPVVAALALGGILAALGVRYQADQAALQRDERALALVTASDTQLIRLTAASGVPDATHGTYRGKPGATIAVMTFSNFPPAPAGRVYQAWALRSGTWTSLGTVQPDANGSARLIAEGPDLALPPEAIQVTPEPGVGGAAPSGPALIAWPGG